MLRDPDILQGYQTDVSGFPGNPEGLVRPKDEAEIADFLRDSFQKGQKVTPVGKQSSTTGSASPLHGVVLSTERLTRLKDIDTKRKIAIVEPGVGLGDFRRTVLAENLFYPPDPTSEDDCALGGSVATNASGARTLLYGPTRRYIRRLRIVLASGKILELKRRNFLEKNTAGYFPFHDPIDLFIGSEGTLGVISEIEVSLLARPEYFFGAFAFFSSLDSALSFVVSARKSKKITPRCLELFDDGALEILTKEAKTNKITIPPEAKAIIFFEQVCPFEKQTSFLEHYLSLLEESNALTNDTVLFEDFSKQREAKRLRHLVPATLNERARKFREEGGRKISTDFAVPLDALFPLLKNASAIIEKANIPSAVCYGHIGNAHPHFNFIAKNHEQVLAYTQIAHQLCQEAIRLGGTVSAEHGIGKVKREFLSYQYSPEILQAMQAIKHSFDPRGILAPGNIFYPA